MLIMAYACKTSSARSIVGVIPYLPYSKQCKLGVNPLVLSSINNSSVLISIVTSKLSSLFGWLASLNVLVFVFTMYHVA